MNEFEQRWKAAASAARGSQGPSPVGGAPFGFAARVLARWQTQAEPPLVLLWQALALRVLGTMMITLLILLAYGEISGRSDQFAPPALESALADSLAPL